MDFGRKNNKYWQSINSDLYSPKAYRLIFHTVAGNEQADKDRIHS